MRLEYGNILEEAGWKSKMERDMDEEIARQMAIRDSYRRKLAWAKTPQQRMREMAEMQKRAFESLCSNPEGYAHFLRRNYRARSVKGWDLP